jgi:hypothetical protein
MNAELQTDDEGPLEFCTVDLLPRYAVEQRGTDTDTVASNRRYLQEALHYLDELLEHNHVHSAQSRVQQKSSLDAEFDRIRTTGQRVQPMLPLEKLCRIFSFDRTDWTLIILALRTQLIGDEIKVTLAAELLSREPEDRNQVLNHLRPKSALVKSGILQIHQPKRNTSKTVSLPLDIIQYIICSAHPPYSVRRRLQIMEPFDDFHDYHSAWIKLARAAIDLD